MDRQQHKTLKKVQDGQASSVSIKTKSRPEAAGSR